jgi:multicomponent Na+:H+ antiporter subunit F
MIFITLVAVILGMGITLVRAIAGPTIFDRILAVNVANTQTVLLIAVLGFLTERPDFIDLSLVYALISFVGTLAALKYFTHGHLGDSP